MTPQEIKDNAPDGATHYLKFENGRVYFFKVKWLEILVYGSKGWRKRQADSSVNWLFGWWYNSPDGLYVYRIKPL